MGDNACAVSRLGNNQALYVAHLSVDLVMFLLIKGKRQQAEGQCLYRKLLRGSVLWKERALSWLRDGSS